ncbi:hypothetical protein F5Y16DRAFT_392188 [Xylariaceae sp. FL0255]|nr:hypothetical protein F5Y16DRAFT_392188 [Xylariaceae sp. FL0255]
MSASARMRRHRACYACAEVKRSCDRRLPECQRCLDRDVDCVYPPSRRQQRQATFQPDSFLGYTFDNEPTLETWNTVDNVDVNFALPAIALSHPSMPIFQDTAANPLNELATHSPWFLETNTWIVEHTDRESGCDKANPEEFIEAIQSMLKSWVETGHNGFIHHQLYRHGLPRCLQDAFTTLSSYINRTAAMKGTVLEIAHERATTLIAEQNLPTDDNLARLARVHALFIYQCIQLFDGSIRHRALAERQIATLQSWIKQIWDAVATSRDEQGPHRQTLENGLGGALHDIEMEIWRSWVFVESTRRTFIVVSFTTSVYLTMRDGQADCAGGVMFSPGRGLWDAQSASRWFELCFEKAPVLVSCMRPERFLQDHSVAELDDFVTAIWTLLVGSAAMKR